MAPCWLHQERLPCSPHGTTDGNEKRFQKYGIWQLENKTSNSDVFLDGCFCNKIFEKRGEVHVFLGQVTSIICKKCPREKRKAPSWFPALPCVIKPGVPTSSGKHLGDMQLEISRFICNIYIDRYILGKVTHICILYVRTSVYTYLYVCMHYNSIGAHVLICLHRYVYLICIYK